MRIQPFCILLVVAAVVVVLPDCFMSRTLVNEPIEPATVSQLAPGTTTADEVLTLLGAPSEVVQLGKRSAWRYDHIVSKTSGLWLIVFNAVNVDSQADRVWLFFDENEVLKHAGSTLKAHTAEYSFPWEHDHD
jgi:outer membrane protein assembly factor BamE (lipoprotein component of BamABCDE complex)